MCRPLAEAETADGTRRVPATLRAVNGYEPPNHVPAAGRNWMMAEPNACLEEFKLLQRLLAGYELDADSAPADIQAHLATCQDCRERMERLRGELANLRAVVKARPLPDMSTVDWTAKDNAPTLQELPTVFGKYRVIGLLGKGGQAVVYRVVNPSLGRDLVVKVAAGRWEENPTSRQRLTAEGRDPGPARPSERGPRRRSIGRRRSTVPGHGIRSGTDAPAISCRPAVAVPRGGPLAGPGVRGLGQRHALGIVHQDVKPANIIIDPDGRPKLLDFGLARLSQVWPEDSVAVSGGTLQYLAPEQAQGRLEAVGPPCDVFGVGAVLYDLLVGRPPYCGDDARELLEAAAQCRFDREALAACKAPRKLVAACLKAMSLDPQDRYTSAAQLAHALRQAVRPRRWWLAAGVVAAILMAAATWIVVFRGKAPPAAAENAQYLLQVHPDAKAVVWINQHLPIQPGVPFRIQCRVPKQMQAGLFWYDTKGQLTEIETQRRTSSPDAPTDLLLGPENLAIDDESGMNVVFVCASRREKPTCEQLAPILREVLAGSSAPRLPPANLVTITGSRVALEAARERPRGYVRQPSRRGVCPAGTFR